MKKNKTHAQIYVEDKEKLERIRDKEGFASIAVALGKILVKVREKK